MSRPANAAEGRYARLVIAMHAGARPPAATIRAVLLAADKTAEDLVDDVLAGHRPAGPTPGSPCARCGAPIRVESSRLQGRYHVRYLYCPACRAPAGKQVAPAATVRRRSKNRPM